MACKERMISVIDGQGGGIGKSIVGKLSKLLDKNMGITVCALGTNANATANMMKAGADLGATGENAIVHTVNKSEIIMGPIAIIAANSMMGELTPVMAEAISTSPAMKLLIPLNRCNIMITADLNNSTEAYIDYGVRMALEYLERT